MWPITLAPTTLIYLGPHVRMYHKKPRFLLSSILFNSVSCLPVSPAFWYQCECECVLFHRLCIFISRLTYKLRETMSTYYVDVDGTLLCGSLSRLYHKMRQTISREEAMKLVDGETQRYEHMGVNHELVERLKHLKCQGNRLVLWTNRSQGVRDATRTQLGPYWNLFEEHLFREGNKLNDRLHGFVIDDDERHARCGLHGFIHVTWTCCHDLSCGSRLKDPEEEKGGEEMATCSIPTTVSTLVGNTALPLCYREEVWPGTTTIA